MFIGVRAGCVCAALFISDWADRFPDTQTLTVFVYSKSTVRLSRLFSWGLGPQRQNLSNRWWGRLHLWSASLSALPARHVPQQQSSLTAELTGCCSLCCYPETQLWLCAMSLTMFFFPIVCVFTLQVSLSGAAGSRCATTTFIHNNHPIALTHLIS